MTTLKDAWYEQERWATESTDALCLLDLRRRVEALEALEQQRAATEESSATEPSSMSNASAGLQKIQEIQEKMQEEGRTLASLFDKALEPSKAAPAPAEDEPLWKRMQRAYNFPDGGERVCYAAEIDAVAERLEEHGYHNAGDFLRTEARRAREQ